MLGVADRTKLLCRLGVVGVVGLQAFLVTHAIPFEDRWFLHPDDHEVYVFAQQVARTGVPSFANDTSGISPWPVFNSPNAAVVAGRLVAFRAPGIFFALALPAAISVKAAFIAQAGFTAVAIVLMYALAERLYAPFPALLASALFAFSASTMFWGAFLFANLPALAVLLGACRCLVSSRPWVQAVGTWLLVLGILFRYEYVLFTAVLGAGWLWQNRAALRTPRKLRWPLAAGILGGVLVAVVLYALQHTVNLVAIGHNVQDPTTAAVAGSVESVVQTNLLRDGFITYALPLFVVPLICSAATFLVRPRASWLVLLFIATAVLVGGYFLSTGSAPQRFFMSNSQTRYLLPLLAAGSLGIAHLARSAARSVWVLGLLVSCVALHAVGNVTLVSGPDGFESAGIFTRDAVNHTHAADLLPLNAVIVGDWAAKEILNRPVLCPINIPPDQQKKATLDAIHVLLDRNRTVFLASSSGTQLSAYDRGKYAPWIQSDPALTIRPSAIPGYYQVLLRGQ